MQFAFGIVAPTATNLLPYEPILANESHGAMQRRRTEENAQASSAHPPLLTSAGRSPKPRFHGGARGRHCHPGAVPRPQPCKGWQCPVHTVRPWHHDRAQRSQQHGILQRLQRIAQPRIPRPAHLSLTRALLNNKPTKPCDTSIAPRGGSSHSSLHHESNYRPTSYTQHPLNCLLSPHHGSCFIFLLHSWKPMWHSWLNLFLVSFSVSTRLRVLRNAKLFSGHGEVRSLCGGCASLCSLESGIGLVISCFLLLFLLCVWACRLSFFRRVCFLLVEHLYLGV